MKRTLIAFVILVMAEKVRAQIYIPKFDIQGHRGCRGLMPENTIPAFLVALDSGVTTIELDLAITKDKQIVVSHEPWMSAAICLDSTGKSIKVKDEKKHNIYRMTYDQVELYDCGSKPNERFPQQQKLSTNKPRLLDVILTVENYIKNRTRYEVDYNIEIKSEPETDNKFHPKPQEFSDLVFNLIDQYLPWERVVIQSFDFRVLKYWHQKHPEVRLAVLVENLNTIDENINALGFTPSIYSPDYKLLTKSEIQHIHDLGMRAIPWTVNDENEMLELKSWGVDGLITDYPNLAVKIKQATNGSDGRGKMR